MGDAARCRPRPTASTRLGPCPPTTSVRSAGCRSRASRRPQATARGRSARRRDLPYRGTAGDRSRPRRPAASRRRSAPGAARRSAADRSTSVPAGRRRLRGSPVARPMPVVRSRSGCRHPTVARGLCVRPRYVHRQERSRRGGPPGTTARRDPDVRSRPDGRLRP